MVYNRIPEQECTDTSKGPTMTGNQTQYENGEWSREIDTRPSPMNDGEAGRRKYPSRVTAERVRHAIERWRDELSADEMAAGELFAGALDEIAEARSADSGTTN